MPATPPPETHRRLLFVVTEDWYFVSHRLGLARAAAAAGYEVAVATRVRELPSWRDSDALWTRALKVTRDNYTAMLNLSALRIDQGRVPEAAALLREAVRLRPDNPMIRSNLGLVLTHLGESEEAAVHYRRALELEPRVYAGRP